MKPFLDFLERNVFTMEFFLGALFLTGVFVLLVFGFWPDKEGYEVRETQIHTSAHMCVHVIKGLDQTVAVCKTIEECNQICAAQK